MLNGTVALLLAHGADVAWHTFLLGRYHEQLSPIGVGVEMLRDDGANASDHVRRSSLAIGTGWSVPVCHVGWAAVERRFAGGGSVKAWAAPTAEFASRLPRPFGPWQHHGFYLALYSRHCVRPSVEHVWTFEQDAYFTGDVGSFVGAFREEPADLIAAGFRIATPQWWQWDESVKWALNRGLRSFGAESGVVGNVRVLRGLEPALCTRSVHPLCVAGDVR